MWSVSFVFLLVTVVYGALALPQQPQHSPLDVQSQCGPYSDCVPQFLCSGGVIVTDGSGFLDLRFKYTKCINPENPDANSVCCRIPGQGPPPTPAPLTACPGGKECLYKKQCNPDGTINTDGTGLIDLRTFVGQTCYVNALEVGVCCIPHLPFVEVCTENFLCVYQCPGLALDYLGEVVPYTPSITQWTQCPLSDGSRGVCCQPTIPSYDVCPNNSLCVTGIQCTGEAYDYTSTWVSHSQDYQFWATCPLSDGTFGICCQPIIPSYELCPDGGICTPGPQCTGQAYDYTGTWSPYSVNYRFWSTCSLGGGRAPGVCCQPAIPSVDQCPGNTVCFSGQDCRGQAVDYAGNLVPYTLEVDYWTQCSNGIPSGGPGVCCEPPPVDVCPGVSVCTPSILCIGQALDYSDHFLPYNPLQSSDWTSCQMQGGGLGIPGVCCLPFNSYPAAERCGVRNEDSKTLDTRIIGHNPETKFGEFPWQAIIFFSNHTFRCGATLIGTKWLLTAAHCVSGLYANQLRARLGEWKVNAFDEPKPYVDVEVSDIHIHPEYIPGPVFNDVAVIELSSPVTYEYHINRVCIGNGEYPNASAYVGKRCWVTGWGKDAFSEGNYQFSLKKVDLPIVAHNTCQDLLRKTRLGKYFTLHESFMCAGGEENKDTCRGDGGGPLVCEQNGHYTLIGITAWGIGCGTLNVPGVYADVAFAYNFINRTLSGSHHSQQYGQ